MKPMEIIAQVLGLFGMVIALLSFQQKTQKRIVLMQFCSSTLFSIHFLMLGAVTGGVLNAFAVIRALIYTQKGKKWADHKIWLVLFTVIPGIIYAMTFLLFGVEPSFRNLLLELLPTLGMIATTFAFRMEKAAHVRRLSLINSPLWLIYNAINLSLGGILTETFSLISILIGILRLDIKRKSK